MDMDETNDQEQENGKRMNRIRGEPLRVGPIIMVYPDILGRLVLRHPNNPEPQAWLGI